MVKALKLVGLGLLAAVVATVLSFRIFGLEPKDQRPGLWLSGEVVDGPVTDWSFTDSVDEIYVQTNTRYGVPHSVTTYCTDYDGQFYLFLALLPD